MTKLHYGPRFRPTGVSVGYRYDKKLDFRSPPFRGPHNPFWTIKAQATVSAKKAPAYLGKSPVKVDERYEAEKRLVERIDQAVDVVSFALQEAAATHWHSAGYSRHAQG